MTTRRTFLALSAAAILLPHSGRAGGLDDQREAAARAARNEANQTGRPTSYNIPGTNVRSTVGPSPQYSGQPSQRRSLWDYFREGWRRRNDNYATTVGRVSGRTAAERNKGGLAARQ